MFSKLPFAVGARGSRSNDTRVFALARGIRFDDRGGRGFDAIRSEQIREPGVNVGEQPVLAYREAWRMPAHRQRVVGAHLAAV